MEEEHLRELDGLLFIKKNFLDICRTVCVSVCTQRELTLLRERRTVIQS